MDLKSISREVEEADVGIQLGSSKKKVGGMIFADDIARVRRARRVYRSLAHRYCNKWRLKANVSKSAVMAFARNPVEREWKWGENIIPAMFH